MDVEHDLISLSAALEHVTSVLLSPIMAQQRLCEALERGELAAWAENIVLKRGEQYIAYNIDGDHTQPGPGRVPPEQKQLGPDWLPPEAWEHAHVDWAASSFQRPAMMVHAKPGGPIWFGAPPLRELEEYVITGVCVSAQHIQQLFPGHAP
jgi:hypothetical protein